MDRIESPRHANVRVLPLTLDTNLQRKCQESGQLTLEGLQGFSSLSWSVGVRGLEEQYFIFSREMRGGEARANILTCFSTPDSLDKLTGTERGDGTEVRNEIHYR